MEIQIRQINGVTLAEVIADNVIIQETQDALDLMADCGYRGSKNIILKENHIVTDFFDLKTGIAGDILQKFSNYGVKLAIVGDYSKYTSKSLKDFILESNKRGRINFVATVGEAVEKLTKQ